MCPCARPDCWPCRQKSSEEEEFISSDFFTERSANFSKPKPQSRLRNERWSRAGSLETETHKLSILAIVLIDNNSVNPVSTMKGTHFRCPSNTDNRFYTAVQFNARRTNKHKPYARGFAGGKWLLHVSAAVAEPVTVVCSPTITLASQLCQSCDAYQRSTEPSCNSSRLTPFSCWVDKLHVHTVR